MQANTTCMRPAGRAFEWLAMWIFCFAAGYAFCWGMGVSPLDECWFLQVVRRVLSGERLYRDVCFETTPLSMYAASFVCSMLKTQILVTKGLLAACFAFTTFFSVRVIRQFRSVPPGWIVPVIAFFIVYCPAYPNSLYNPMAMVFYLACMDRCMAWIRSGGQGNLGGRRILFAAGAAAGLCAATKQNIGVLVLAAAMALVVEEAITERRSMAGTLRSLFRIACAFTGVIALVVLLPILATGGWKMFLYHGIRSKFVYFHLPISYWGQIRHLADLLTHPSRTNLINAYFQMPWLLPAVVLPGLAIGWLRSRSAARHRAAALFFFSGFGFLSAYPRFDFFHLCVIVPCLALGLFWLVSHLRPVRFRKALFIAVMLWFAFGAFRLYNITAHALFGRSFCRSELPHLKNAVFRREEYRNLTRTANLFARLSPDRKVFILGVDAGFYSLAADLKNPTPFDYPLVSVMGSVGQNLVMRMIETNEIPVAVVLCPHPAWGGLWPAELAAFIESRMEKVMDIESGAVYKIRSDQPALGTKAR